MKSYRYTVRFNLGKQKDKHGNSKYLKWKIYDRWTMTSTYLDRDLVSLMLFDCKLVNQPNTAKTIFDGAHKTVCAHISCNVIQFQLPGLDISTEEVQFNPRKAPNWVFEDLNADNKTFDQLVTNSNRVYII